MRIPVILCAILLANQALRAVDLTEPNVPVPEGFELRVLETPLSAVISEGEKKTDLRLPVWVMTPKRGSDQENPEELTEPKDYVNGANVLPAPPKGFTLRALKTQHRQIVKQKSGRNLAVDCPLWIYYKVSPLHPNAEPITAYKADALTISDVGRIGEFPKPTPVIEPIPPRHNYAEDEAALNQLDELLLKYRQEVVKLRSSVDTQVSNKNTP